MAQVSRWTAPALVIVTLCLADATAMAQLPPAPLPMATEASPLLNEPKTPEEFFDATLLLVDLGRFDLARKYLDQFEQGDPTPETLLKIRAKQGTAAFLKLARIPELQPTGKAVLTRLTQAAQSQVEDAGFVDGLIERVFGPQPGRSIAMQELRNVGPRAAPPVLKALNAAATAEQRDALTITVARMGRQVIPVLLGALNSPHQTIVDASLDVLQQLDAKETAPHLWALAFGSTVPPGTQLMAQRTLAKFLTGNPDRVQAVSSVVGVNDLKTRSEELFARRVILPADSETEAKRTYWLWDDKADMVVARTDDVQTVSLEQAAHFAHDALILSPERADIQRLVLATRLAFETHRNGWDRPLPKTAGSTVETAVTAGPKMVTQTLADALAWGRTDAVWPLLTVLKEMPSREILRSREGGRSPVIAALNYPDPRVQFEAAIVALRTEPMTEFPGASRVVDALRRALTDSGQPRALVIDPDQAEATTIAGYLADRGYDGVLAATGKQGFTKAAELSGIDFVVVHANVAEWGLTQTIANLRADSRTAFQPIYVYGPEELRAKLARLLARTPLSAFVSEAAAGDAFWVQAEPLLQQLKTPPLTPQQRSEQQLFATYWLAAIATGRNARLFDISSAEAALLPLVEEEPLAANALVALGTIPTPNVQTRLAEMALNGRLPTNTRILAAEQLAAHIQRFGVVLSEGEIRGVTAGYETADDAGIRGALAAVVGTFDPNAGLITERLQRLARP